MVGMDTKTALLTSAEAAARAHGYDGFSYADLAAAVGIRKASIHYHFPTKADLALALIERYSDNLFATLDQIAETNHTGGARLAACVAAYRDAAGGGKRLCLCVALCTGRDGLSRSVLAKLDAFHATIASWLGNAFAMGKADNSIAFVMDCEVEAHACLAQMQGAQLIARAAEDIRRFDAAVAGLLQRVRQ